MYIIHSGKKYKIDKLSKHSEYFDTLKSNHFIENQNQHLDLSHRGQPMKDVLDMIIEEDVLSNLSSDRLKKMKPILDEFLFSENWLWAFDENNNYHCIIHSALEKERQERQERQINEIKKKEGDICQCCNKINKWLKPQDNLDWEDERCYCSCNYIRDDFGDRIDNNEWLDEYYSNDENCKHGSSLFYT